MKSVDTKFLFTEKILLYLLPTISFIIIPLVFFEPNLSLLGSYISVPIFSAIIAYIIYQKRKILLNDTTISPDYLSHRIFLLLLILYCMCLAISIFLLVIFDIRPIVYFGLITIMSSIILFEILSFEISYGKTIVILIQIMILFLNIIWSMTLKYYFFISRTDPLAHVWYIENLISQSYVTDVFGQYQNFPLWHIMVVGTYKLMGIDVSIQKLMFFINGIIYTVLIIAIYLLSLKIFNNKKLALLSVLFAAINSGIIMDGMRSLPRSVVVFFMVILILLLEPNNFRKLFLASILTFIIIMYHTASMPFIISILSTIYLINTIYNVKYEKIFLSWKYLLLAFIATLTYWIFHAKDTFGTIVRNIFNPAPTGIITLSTIYSPLDELFNYLQYSPLLFFVIFGVLLSLRSNMSGFGKAFNISMLILSAIAIPGPGLIFNKLSSNFSLERFGEYLYVFIVMVAAIGFLGIYQIVGKKLKIIIMILFIIMSFLSISNDFNASDNPLVKRVFYTSYLDEKEIVAFNHIANFTNGFVLSDYVTKRYLLFSQYGSKSHLLEVNPINNMFLRNNNSDVILIRNQELYKRPLRFFISKNGKFELNPSEKGYLDYYYQDSHLWNSLEKYNKMYDSGGIKGLN